MSDFSSKACSAYLFWKYFGYGHYFFEFYSNSDIVRMARDRIIYPCPHYPNPFTFADYLAEVICNGISSD